VVGLDQDVDFRSFGNVADPLVFKGTLTDLRRALYNLTGSHRRNRWACVHQLTLRTRQ